jgi:hypothetical protein
MILLFVLHEGMQIALLHLSHSQDMGGSLTLMHRLSCHGAANQEFWILPPLKQARTMNLSLSYGGEYTDYQQISDSEGYDAPGAVEAKGGGWFDRLDTNDLDTLFLNDGSLFDHPNSFYEAVHMPKQYQDAVAKASLTQAESVLHCLLEDGADADDNLDGLPNIEDVSHFAIGDGEGIVCDIGTYDYENNYFAMLPLLEYSRPEAATYLHVVATVLYLALARQFLPAYHGPAPLVVVGFVLVSLRLSGLDANGNTRSLR